MSGALGETNATRQIPHCEKHRRYCWQRPEFPSRGSLFVQFLSMSAIEPALRPRCPQCSGHGLVRGLEITPDRRTLRFECDTCTHEWHVTDQDPVRTWNGIPIERGY